MDWHTARNTLVPCPPASCARRSNALAEAGDWFFETGLVDLLLRESLNGPGGLPLLSNALLETWKQRRGQTLTLVDYAKECCAWRVLTDEERVQFSLPKH